MVVRGKPLLQQEQSDAKNKQTGIVPLSYKKQKFIRAAHLFPRVHATVLFSRDEKHDGRMRFCFLVPCIMRFLNFLVFCFFECKASFTKTKAINSGFE